MRLFSCSLYVCVQHRLPLERFKNIPCPAQCRHSAPYPPPSLPHTTARVVVLLRMLQKLRVDVASAISKAFRGNQSQASSGCNSSTASRKTKLSTGERERGGREATQCSHVQVKLLGSRHFCRSHCIFSIIWRNFTAYSGNRNCFLALPMPIAALKGINLCSLPAPSGGRGGA